MLKNGDQLQIGGTKIVLERADAVDVAAAPPSSRPAPNPFAQQAAPPPANPFAQNVGAPPPANPLARRYSFRAPCLASPWKRSRRTDRTPEHKELIAA